MSIAGVSPIRGAMDRPRPGGTTLVIMVTPEPGKYASWLSFSPFYKLTATGIERELGASINSVYSFVHMSKRHERVFELSRTKSVY